MRVIHNEQERINSGERWRYDWGEHIRIFFVPNRYTKKMGEDKSLFKFKPAKITYSEMQGLRNSLVIKDSFTTRRIFANKKDMTDSVVVFSMWDGYLPEVKPFWDTHNIPIFEVHSSGHAFVEELQEFVRAVKPAYIIPNHTFHPERYTELFDCPVKLTKDKETIEL
jgi:ribonuclease J